jgi:hypothetical protein
LVAAMSLPNAFLSAGRKPLVSPETHGKKQAGGFGFGFGFGFEPDEAHFISEQQQDEATLDESSCRYPLQGHPQSQAALRRSHRKAIKGTDHGGPAVPGHESK